MSAGPTGGRILGYGLPGLPLALPGLPLAVYLPAYYTQDIGLSLLAVGGALFAARLFDIASDLAIGLVSDQLRRRGLSRKLMMLAGVPVMILGIQALFAAPPDAGFAYLLGWNLAAYAGWTLVAVPYYAWGAELSADRHTRTRLAAAREGFTIAGICIAIALPVLLGIAAEPGRVLAVISGMLWLALPLAVLGALLLAPERPPAPAAGSAARGWTALLANRPLRRLVAAYLLSNAANALPAALFIFFIGHVLQAQDTVGTFLGVYFLAGIVALPLWVRLSRRYGKAPTWILSMLLACAAFVWAPWLGPGDLLAYGVICLVSGIALGADLALPASLQADMVDLDARHAGRQRAGLLFGLWGLTTKLAAAIGIGVAFAVLAAAGFEPDGSNSGPALLTLALLYGLAPVLLKVAAIVLARGITAGTVTPTLPAPRAGKEKHDEQARPVPVAVRAADERL